MSVINQVLNQLEQRGAHAVAEQTMVRAVPNARRSYTIPVSVIGVVLAVGLVDWLWTHKPNVAADNIAPKTTPEISNREGAGTAMSANVVEKIPAAVAADENKPATRLSFELSTIPLPTTLLQGLGQDSLKVEFASNQPHTGEVSSTGTGQVSSTGSGQALRIEKNISLQPAASVKLAKVTDKTTPKSTAKTSGKTSGKKLPIAAAPSNKQAAVQSPNDALPMKQISVAQKADAEYRKAVALMQQGRIADALAGFEAALRMDAGHDAARQTLVALLLENKRGMDAERVLQERLKSKPDHTGFTMMLARLQVERGAIAQATGTLEKALPFAHTQADYQAFLAALLQRQNRNDEAIKHYQFALQQIPNNAIWLVGYGISLQAVQRNADAKVAYKHALETQTLNPELQAFAQQKLKGL